MLTSKGEQSHDGTVLLTTCKVCLIDLPVREIQFLTQKGASLDPIMEVYSVVFGLLGIPFLLFYILLPTLSLFWAVCALWKPCHFNWRQHSQVRGP